MKLLLVAIEATCRTELSAGKHVPSEDLQALAISAGLQSKTLDGLRLEAKRKFEAALSEAFA